MNDDAYRFWSFLLAQPEHKITRKTTHGTEWAVMADRFGVITMTETTDEGVKLVNRFFPLEMGNAILDAYDQHLKEHNEQH